MKENFAQQQEYHRLKPLEDFPFNKVKFLLI